VAVPSACRRPHDWRTRSEKRVEDGAGGLRANERRVDQVDEHRVHARPVGHGEACEHRRELPLVAAGVLDDPRRQASPAHGLGHGAMLCPRDDNEVVDAGLEQRPADPRHEGVVADGQKRLRPPHA
jgi:hypothetical protein